MAQGFVYSGELTGEDLRNLLKRLGNNFVHFAWTLKNFFAGESVPNEFGDSGTAFNQDCEIKWQRTDGEKFLVLLLSDSQVDNLPLAQVDGEWEVEEQETYLFSLEDKRILPPFTQYPAVNSSKAKLRCKVFYRDSVAVFISPREVTDDEKTTTG